MICDNLQATFVKDLDAAGERGIVRCCQSKVRDVHDVGEEEDVDEDVWVVDAGDSYYCIEEAPNEEDTGVESLVHGRDVDTQVKSSNTITKLL